MPHVTLRTPLISNDIKDFSSYFVNVNMSDVEQQEFFFRQFFLSLAILFMIFFSSFSLLGILKVSFLTFTKGVQIGFSCLLFLYTYEIKGILGIIMVLIPQVVFDVLYISVLSYGAIDYSYHLLYESGSGTKGSQVRNAKKSRPSISI